MPELAVCDRCDKMTFHDHNDNYLGHNWLQCRICGKCKECACH